MDEASPESAFRPIAWVTSGLLASSAGLVAWLVVAWDSGASQVGLVTVTLAGRLSGCVFALGPAVIWGLLAWWGRHPVDAGLALAGTLLYAAAVLLVSADHLAVGGVRQFDAPPGTYPAAVGTCLFAWLVGLPILLELRALRVGRRSRRD